MGGTRPPRAPRARSPGASRPLTSGPGPLGPRWARSEQQTVAANLLCMLTNCNLGHFSNIVSMRCRQCSVITDSSQLIARSRYLFSISTMHRLLPAAGECWERRRQRNHPAKRKPELMAAAPGGSPFGAQTIERIPYPRDWASMTPPPICFSRSGCGCAGFGIHR